jgi:hypothetical protein
VEYNSRKPRLRTHSCILSRAESGFISLYTEGDLEDDEADVQENGTLTPYLYKMHVI